jgi:hypothetical protein
MVGAPTEGERVTDLLLDGQQRLTALWRSLTDDYPERRYFVRVPVGEFSFDDLEVEGVARWTHRNTRYPVWADSPAACWGRRLVPLSVSRPGENGEREAAEWVAEASGADSPKAVELTRLIGRLRARVAEFNLPFLELPVTTAREVALDVFVKLNTRMVRLSSFDIVVAQVEDETGQSLHDRVVALNGSVPALKFYDEPEDIVLATAALLQGYPPYGRSYFAMDLRRMMEEWEQIVTGCSRAVAMLEDECVFDGQRLPTVSVLAPLVALWSVAPIGGDAEGNARAMLRKYLWRASFSGRYERAAGTAALQDYRALREALLGSGSQDKVPGFSDKLHALPSMDELSQAGWPTRRETLARAVLAVSLRGGAHDICDASQVSRANLQNREYHHLFPAAYLRDRGVLPDETNRALNCALITWKSNRSVGAQEPVKYLRDRADAAGLGEQEIRDRLATHGISYDLLASNDYEAFTRGRAETVFQAMTALCDGRAWSPPRQ